MLLMAYILASFAQGEKGWPLKPERSELDPRLSCLPTRDLDNSSTLPNLSFSSINCEA